MDNLDKIGRSLMDNWGEIRQLINILFCGYRRSKKMQAETYTRVIIGPGLIINLVPLKLAEN